MITYKDQSFCQDWCLKVDCFRNYNNIIIAQQPGQYLHENPWMPISFLMKPPKDCIERIPKEKLSDIVEENDIGMVS